jgi:hypothetical protein
VSYMWYQCVQRDFAVILVVKWSDLVGKWLDGGCFGEKQNFEFWENLDFWCLTLEGIGELRRHARVEIGE